MGGLDRKKINQIIEICPFKFYNGLVYNKQHFQCNTGLAVVTLTLTPRHRMNTATVTPNVYIFKMIYEHVSTKSIATTYKHKQIAQIQKSCEKLKTKLYTIH